jgi:hypothetical protein
MGDKDNPWVHARGIGDALIGTFFPSFEGNREEALTFYGDRATLYFQGTEIVGSEAISAFLSGVPPFSCLHVDAFDVQPIPRPASSWFLIVATGKLSFGNHFSTFHSTFCVESRQQDCTAFIRSHSFTWF